MTYTESARAQLNALQTKDHVRILALETSCDETAAAIYYGTLEPENDPQIQAAAEYLTEKRK